MSDAETFRCERHGPVAVVVFTGPHHANALSRRRMRELRGLLLRLEADPTVRAVVLRADEEYSFSVGGDFHEMRYFVGGAEADAWSDDIADLCVTTLEVTKPIVAALDGHVMGVGVLLALACDYRVGSESCSLRMPHFELGVVGVCAGYVLERSLGRSLMQEMLVSGEPWSSEDALSDGLLQRVVPDIDLAATALKLAERFAAYDATAFRVTKRHLNRSYALGLRDVQRTARSSHRAAFATGLPQRRMRRILGDD
ncbi:enoyl-CoA hydratase/isomerase family protein [Streptomyces sp. Ag109_G2-15]|uniref:enoyl-CoA hydratase/isomerase family protein n=1 Tax=Streptomyces sp. Ag109_G2-15 TaxID=1938850 RepID=UPI000BD54B74|nr:enoyl-CoA hydratase/isomerase family protein [Streptomyces sp. Ag109_G2-15]SOD85383.1 enoyl-CoA hydratase/enoyl-CoA hydratase [Streptomyces sp. Ag109_G2-15]